MEKRNFGIILILSLLLLYLPTFIRAQAFQKGDNAISVGYGFAEQRIYDGDLIYWQVLNYDSQTGPFYLKYENALSDRTSMGININYGYFKNNFTGYDYSTNTPTGPFTLTDFYSIVNILARINWHYGDSNKFDPYCGFGLGYRSYTTWRNSNDPSIIYNNKSTYASANAEITIGARYYLNNNFAIYVETGYSQSVFQFGLTYKLR